MDVWTLNNASLSTATAGKAYNMDGAYIVRRNVCMCVEVILCPRKRIFQEIGVSKPKPRKTFVDNLRVIIQQLQDDQHNASLSTATAGKAYNMDGMCDDTSM
jgi:hypothetical protein